MKKFIYALAMAALFTGCIKEDAHEIDTIDDNQIRFSTGMDVETRAPISGNAFAGGEQIGIFAVRHTAPATPTWPASGSYHMENIIGTVAATTGTVALSGTGPYLWPESDYVDFYAYYPHTNSIAIAAGTAPTLSISTPNYTTDYLWADPSIAPNTNKNKAAHGSSPVALTFKHAFSLIRVKVMLDQNMPSSSLSMSALSIKTSSGTSNQTGTLNIANGVFTTPNGIANYSHPTLSTSPVSISKGSYTEVGQILFAPNTVITELSATLGGVAYTKTGLTTISTQAAGTATDIQVIITPTSLLFTATVTDWIPGTTVPPIIAQ